MGGGDFIPSPPAPPKMGKKTGGGATGPAPIAKKKENKNQKITIIRKIKKSKTRLKSYIRPLFFGKKKWGEKKKFGEFFRGVKGTFSFNFLGSFSFIWETFYSNNPVYGFFFFN